MIRRLAWLLVPLAFASVAHAFPEGAVPTASRFSVRDVSRLDSVLAAPLDLERIGKEDAAADRKGVPPRFAVPERVSITPFNRGTWEDLGNGEMLWRLRILGREGSTSLNLGFTRFHMSEGSRLMVYSTDGGDVVRPFTAADNEGRTELWTPVVVTRDLIVELHRAEERDAERRPEARLDQPGLPRLRNGPRPLYTKSGSCKLDVECLASTDPLTQAGEVGGGDLDRRLQVLLRIARQRHRQ